MPKDPAFLFYPGDYLRDTQTLSEKSQVSYDRIMCEHMRNSFITKLHLKFFTKKLSSEEIEELMFVLSETEDGYQINWVAESIEKRKKFTESRRNNRKKGSNAPTHIYLIKDMETNNIKIGNSVDPERRLIELKNQSGKDYIILCYTEKTEQKKESELHKKFNSYRVSGEWFYLKEKDITDHMITHMNLQIVYHMNGHMENENENENINKKVKPKKIATEAPETFELTNKHCEYAKKKNHTGNLENMTESFLLYHRAKGNKFKCWYSAWQKWLINDIKFKKENNNQPATKTHKDL